MSSEPESCWSYDGLANAGLIGRGRVIPRAHRAAACLTAIFLLLPASAQAQSSADRSTEVPAYCAELQRVVALALSKDRFASITGKPQQGNFLETTLPLTGWHGCSLYGSGTYTCDSPEFDSAGQAQAAQVDMVQQVKTCLGSEWSEALNQSSPTYVILQNNKRPVSITLSTDQTD